MSEHENFDDGDAVIDSTSETRPKTHFSVALRYSCLYIGGNICSCPATSGYIATNLGHGVNFVSVDRLAHTHKRKIPSFF